MATAPILNFTPSANIQSPLVAEKLKKDSSKIVAINAASPQKSAKAMLTTSAPQLNPTSSVSNVSSFTNTSGATYLGMLAAYMASMILCQIALSKNQSNLNQAQFSNQNELVNLSQSLATKADNEYKAYEAALQAEQHQSWLSKVLGGIAAALCCVLAAFTGGATAFLGAALVTTFMMAGGQSALDNAIGNLSPALQALVNLGVAVAGTIVCCGVTGLLSTALSTAAESGAEDAAASGANAAADSAAQSGVQDAVSDSVDAIGDDLVVENQVTAEENSLGSKALKFASKSMKLGFNKANVLGNGTQLMASLNPLGDAIQAILQKAGVDSNVAQLVGQITGELLTMAGGAAATYGLRDSFNENMDTTVDLLRNKIGSGNFTRANISIGVLRSCFQMATAGINVWSGVTKLQIADFEKSTGATQALQTVVQAMVDIVNQQTQSDSKSFSNEMDVYAQMTAQFDAFVAPGAVAAEILG